MPNNDILDWNDRIEDDGSGEFTILPPGEYAFKVTGFEKQHSNNSQAPMAKVTLEVEHDGELVNVFDYLVLTKKAEWKLCSFFRCLGLKKHGEPFVMQWNRVVGATGRAKLHVEKYTKKDGTAGESNKVKQYLDAPAGRASAPSAAPPTSKPVAYANHPDEDDDGLI